MSTKKRAAFGAGLAAVLTLSGIVAAATSANAAIDVSNGDRVIGGYNATKASSITITPTVDIANCNAGTIDGAQQTDILAQLNYSRGLGQLDPVQVGNSDLVTKAQQGALLMAANGRISHAFPTNAKCYTDGGNQAVASAVLSAAAGYKAYPKTGELLNNLIIDDWVRSKMGHRIQLLNPYLATTGIGLSGQVDGSFNWGYLDVVTLDSGSFAGNLYNTAATTPEIVGWPSNGYFPYKLLPTLPKTSYNEAEHYWTASIKGLNIASAPKVTVTGPEGAVNVTEVHTINGSSQGLRDYNVVAFRMPQQLPQPADGTSADYKVTIEAGGKTYTYTPKLIVTAPKPLAAPTFTTQPETQTAKSTGTYTFNAAAEGNPAPTLQWQSSADGATWANVEGATGTSLQVEVTKETQTMKYRALASNSVQADVASTVVQLIVDIPQVAKPVLVSSPVDVSVPAGQEASFRASFNSAAEAPMTYMWETSTDGGNNWAAIEGATEATYTIASTTLEQNGHQFRITATNEGGKTGAAIATLTVTEPLIAPTFTTQPQSQGTLTTGTFKFTVAAEGNPAPTLQWQSSEDGDTWANLEGETSPTLSVEVVKGSKTMKYRALASNSVQANVPSEVAVLTVALPQPAKPKLMRGPSDRSVAPGEEASFNGSFYSSDDAPMTYAWETSTDGGKTWSTIEGATETTYTIASATLEQNGHQFRLAATNVSGTVKSAGGTLTVKEPVPVPSIVKHPEDQSVVEGETATFTVELKDYNPNNLQWQSKTGDANWTSITGTKSTTYTFTTKLADNGTQYRILLSHADGESVMLIPSDPATLTVTKKETPTEGEGTGETPTEGDGTGETPTEGDGSQDGTGETPTEGEGTGETPTEGEGTGETPTEGDGTGDGSQDGNRDGEGVPALKALLSKVKGLANSKASVTVTGLNANETVEIWFHSTPVKLGTATADAKGTLAYAFTVPAKATPGAHNVVVKRADGTEIKLPYEVAAPKQLRDKAAKATPATAKAKLAKTGADLLVPGIITVLLLAGGAVLLVARKKR